MANFCFDARAMTKTICIFIKLPLLSNISSWTLIWIDKEALVNPQMQLPSSSGLPGFLSLPPLSGFP
jgi:hypothetical protein